MTYLPPATRRFWSVLLTAYAVAQLLLLAAPAFPQDAQPPNPPAATPAPSPTPAPEQKPVGVLPSFDVTGAAVLSHVVGTGWHTPNINVGALALGPHWGPLYVGGTVLFQNTDGSTSAGVALLSYVGQGYLHGWFRGLVVSFGKTIATTGSDGKPQPVRYWFAFGVAR